MKLQEKIKFLRIHKGYFLTIFFVGISTLVLAASSEMINASVDLSAWSGLLTLLAVLSVISLCLYLYLAEKTKLNNLLQYLFYLALITFVACLYLTNESLLPLGSEGGRLGPSYGCFDQPGGGQICADKPVIYLYPTETKNIKVRLDFNGRLISTYPSISNQNSWDVIANPDGKLINKADNKEYSYLFWEGRQYIHNYDLSSGFVVKGSDTKDFLQSALSKIGLTPKEYNEMIVYWLPKMEHNKYNLIHFADKEYTDNAKLIISPSPDSMLRVFMVYKKLDKPVKVTTQALQPFNRHGFTVIEWGGTEAN